MLAAAERNRRCSCLGWEDSTLGDMFAAQVISGKVKNATTVAVASIHDGACCMVHAGRGKNASRAFSILAAASPKFPTCVVPMLHQDLKRENMAAVGLLLPISDSTTSYGSYSGGPDENHLGQARRRYAALHHRIRRDDRRPAYFCLRARMVEKCRRGIFFEFWNSDFSDFR